MALGERDEFANGLVLARSGATLVLRVRGVVVTREPSKL